MKRDKTLSHDWNEASRKSEMDSARSWSEGASVEDMLVIADVLVTHNVELTGAKEASEAPLPERPC